MKILAVIPARLESKRLPGKVLRTIGDKPLVQIVYERVRGARKVDEVLIATDSAEVEAACRAFTPDVVVSERVHATGTDRAAEVAANRGADIVINVQCDEPMMDPLLIDAVIDLFDDRAVQMASASARIVRLEDLLDPNVIKVVTDRNGDALYFSRAPIPWPRHDPPRGEGPLPEIAFAHKHIGIYAYRNDCLAALSELPRSPLETLECLEQLRAQDNGWKIRILEWDYRGIDVDTEADLERVRRALKEEGRAATRN